MLQSSKKLCSWLNENFWSDLYILNNKAESFPVTLFDLNQTWESVYRKLLILNFSDETAGLYICIKGLINTLKIKKKKIWILKFEGDWEEL